MSDELRAEIRDRYGAAARAAREAGEATKASATGTGCCGGPAGSSCCGTGATLDDGGHLLEGASALYDEAELAEVPLGARLASLGCGNPVALAELRAGEVVLDLGSGGGIDVLLSARRVGPEGKAYGLDMTDDMLELAERNRRRAGVTNVEFLKGDLERIPLPDASVDVVISNCVVNLSTDKDAALREAYRVLRPGGRLAVSDIVFEGDPGLVPGAVRRRVEAWAACITGAMGDHEYRERLEAAGFTGVGIEVTRVYDPAAEGGVCGCEGIELPEGVRLVSAIVRAVKPA